MSALVGAFWRTTDDEPAARAAYDIVKQAVLPLVKASAITESRLQKAIFLKTDFGVYGSSGLISDQRGTAVICGHPYIEHLRGQPRAAHLSFLATAAYDGRVRDFAEARGTYSFAAIDVRSGHLTLATDCLGIRPLYYLDQGGIVVFSSTLSALRTLKEAIIGPRDERGAVEAAVFGFALQDRTGWQAVRCISAGGAVVFTEDRTEQSQYWSMSQVTPVQDKSARDGQEAVYQAFAEAVQMRAAGASVAAAQLSGGMDSRAVVALLRDQGIRVYSVNFAPPESQDLVYGRAVAAALDCHHTEVPMGGGGVLDDTRTVLGRLRSNTETQEAFGAEASLVWSGDGGSVTLGHVYLTEGMVSAAEAGDDVRAVDLMLAEQSWVVPKGVVRSERVKELIEYPKCGLLEVLRNQRSRDPGRRLHMLLMATDQRRHLHPHFELIYEHRCELQLPFFDRKLVVAAISRPVRPFLYHRFYNQWFQLFPKAVTAVPWQAYPGHEACPIESSEKLMYQWTPESLGLMLQKDRKDYLGKTGRALLKGAFRGTAISPTRTAMAWLATSLRARDLTYALKFSAKLAEL